LVFFNHIKAKISEVSDEIVIFDLTFIGFRIFVSKKDCEILKENLGKEVLIFLSEVIEKEEIKLFGFLDKEERDLFEKLKSVSGIGAKLALKIVGNISPQEFREAIENEDLNILLNVPGIGKKTAQKIFLEMKGVIPKLTSDEVLVSKALYQLGYNKEEVEEVLKDIKKEFSEIKDLEEVIKFALKKLTKE